MSDERIIEFPSGSPASGPPTWPAAIDHELFYEIEECVGNPAVGVHRRGLLAILTMDSTKLIEACNENPEAFFDLFEKSAETVNDYYKLNNLLMAAHSRLAVGLSRVNIDTDDVPFTEEAFEAAVDAAHFAQRRDQVDKESSETG